MRGWLLVMLGACGAANESPPTLATKPFTIAAESDLREANTRCRKWDVEAGFDWEVKSDDAKGIARLRSLVIAR